MNTFYSDVTLGVSSKGNPKALMLCLSSVLTAQFVPKGIQIRLEGEFPSFNEFYLEQLASLARFRGVEFSFSVFNSTGVRDSRDWQIAQCPTQFLWLVDDDVVLDARCLQAYEAAGRANMFGAPEIAFLAGSKGDVNNRRGYPVFKMSELKWADAEKENNHNLFADIDDCWAQGVLTPVLDTGNVLLHMERIRSKGCKFQLFSKDDRFNPSGDATTFSLVLNKAGLKGYLVPAARAYHLEKPGGGFSEFHARGEMLLRLCDTKGFDKQIVKGYYMPGL
jgi:hypothetical protein